MTYSLIIVIALVLLTSCDGGSLESDMFTACLDLVSGQVVVGRPDPDQCLPTTQLAEPAPEIGGTYSFSASQAELECNNGITSDPRPSVEWNLYVGNYRDALTVQIPGVIDLSGKVYSDGVFESSNTAVSANGNGIIATYRIAGGFRDDFTWNGLYTVKFDLDSENECIASSLFTGERLSY